MSGAAGAQTPSPSACGQPAVSPVSWVRFSSQSPCPTVGWVWGAEGQTQTPLGPEYGQMGSAVLSWVLFTATSAGNVGSPDNGSSLPAQAVPTATMLALCPACPSTQLHPQQSHMTASSLCLLPTSPCRVSHMAARCRGALRAEILTQFFLFLRWCLHADGPTVPRVRFQQHKVAQLRPFCFQALLLHPTLEDDLGSR